MPVYVFECKKCSLIYEELASYDVSGKYTAIKCPECKSKKKFKLQTACGHTFTNPEGTDKMSTHDYRYYRKMETVREDRKKAEVASHMGTTPYGHIDDISSGKHFGPLA